MELIGIAPVHVNTQHGAEYRIGVLAVPAGIPTSTAIAEPDVEETVGPKAHLPAIMISEGLVHREYYALRFRVERSARVIREKTRDDGLQIPTPLRVGQYDLPVFLVVRVEREAQQTRLIAARADALANIDKDAGFAGRGIIVEDQDAARLLDDVPVASIARRLEQRNGLGKTKIGKGRLQTYDRTVLRPIVLSGGCASPQKQNKHRPQSNSAGSSGTKRALAHLVLP